MSLTLQQIFLDKAAPKIVKVIGSVSKVLNAFAFRMKLDAISGLVKSIGTSILMLAGSLFIVSKIDSDKLWGAVGAIGALVGVMVAVSFAVSKMNLQGDNPFGRLSLLLMAMSVSILILTKVVGDIGKMNPNQSNAGVLGLAGIAIVLGVLIGAYGRLADGKASKISVNLARCFKLSIALGIMVGVIKLIGMLSANELMVGGAALLAFVFVISLISDISKI